MYRMNEMCKKKKFKYFLRLQSGEWQILWQVDEFAHLGSKFARGGRADKNIDRGVRTGNSILMENCSSC